MRAVVLVGGEGTRLRPLTTTTPKQLLPVAEVPVIRRVLEHLAAHGVTEAVLSLGYRPDAFVAAYPDQRCGDVAVSYAVESEPLGTAGALRFAATSAGIDETFLAFNGDVLSDLDVAALVEFHRRRRAQATIALTRVADPSAYGVVPTDADGRVLAFVEKPPPGTAPTDLINAGAYVLEPSVLEMVPEGRAVSIEREVFPALARVGSLFGLGSPAYWIDVGTPARYLQAQLDLLDGLRPVPPAPDARRAEGDVWTIGDPVVDGKVSGPALVGDAALVAAGACVERSVVGAGARVYDGARVRSSVLLPGSVVREEAVVEDSIVGEQAVVGEGSMLTALTVVAGHARVEAGQRWADGRVPAAGPAPG